MRQHLVPLRARSPLRRPAVAGGSALSLIAALAVSACGDGEAPDAGPASVIVTPAALSLEPGETAALSVAVLDAQGRLLTGVPVEFATSDAGVATVTPTGVVTAVAVVPDTATITVRVPPSGPSGAVPVEVHPVVGGVEISPQSLRLLPGATGQLTARVYDVDGATIPGVPVAFLGRDPQLLTVTPQGLVTASTRWGSTFVVVQYASNDETFADSAAVTVAPIVASPVLSSRPFGLAASASGLVYVTRIDTDVLGSIALPAYSVATGPTVGSVPTDVVFDAAGTTAYVTNQFSQNVGIVDVASGVQTGTIALGADPGVLAIEPGGQRLWVTDNANEVVVIDLPSETITARIPVGFAPNGIAFHPTQPIAYVSAVWAGTVSKIATGTLSVTKVITLGGAPQGLAVAPDGAELYVADEAGAQLKILDLATDAVVGSVTLGAGAFDLHLTPDATQLLAGLPSTGEVVVVDRAARTVFGRIRTGGTPRRIGCAADGSVCLVANEWGWVDVLDW
jgi:YVTN family beta-propeller protein